MGSKPAQTIDTAVALTTSPVDLDPIQTTGLDFVTIGFSCASAATVQNLVVTLKVGEGKEAPLYSNEDGLPSGDFTPQTINIPLANITSGCFRIDTWAIDYLTLSLATSTGTKTLTEVWIVEEGSSSRTPSA